MIRPGDRCRTRVKSVSASGTAIALPGITILHFRGDRVIERFSQADMLGLLIQVGAVPAPA